ncbi:MAG: SPOR domain-containing protein [Deltaproteobacteria bacterium]|nr:SPOR domain-containing protein [Deltaproteobacteria bacterium]
MYCSKCKLRVADDSITICPVCQGPLALVPEAEKPQESDAGRVSPKIRIGEKFDAYTKYEKNLDFDPELLGLQSEKNSSVEADDDIMALSQLWEDEDLDKDLEGIFADALSLDEIEQNKDFTKEFEKELDEELDREIDSVEKSSPFGQSEAFSAEPAPAPAPAMPPARSRSPLFLVLLLLVGLGGAAWYYMHNLGVKPQVAKVEPRTAVTRPAPAAQMEVKEPRVEVPPVKMVEPTGAAPSGVVEEKSGRDTVSAPAAVSESSPSPVAAPVAISVSAPVVIPVPAQISNPAPAAEVEMAAALPSRPTSAAETAAALPVPAPAAAGAEPVAPTKEREAESVQERTNAVAEQAPPAPVASTSDVARLPFAVHIASFRSKARVDRQIALLQAKGFTAYSVEVDLGEKGIWQRVLVPGGTTRAEAETVQQKLVHAFPKLGSLIKKVEQ